MLLPMNQTRHLIVAISVKTSLFFCFIALIVASAVDAFGSTAPTGGLVGYWALDDASGAVATDSSGKGDNGNLLGSATWVAGKDNGALLFNGTSSSVLIPESSATQFGNGSFSVGTWFKSSSQTFGHLISSERAQGSSGWRLVYGMSNSGVQMRISDGTNQYSSSVSAAVDNDAWHYVMGVVDRFAGLLHLYVDGNEVLPAVGITLLGSVSDPTVSTYFGVLGGSIQFYSGVLDEVRFYRRALSPAEVVAVMNDPGLSSNPVSFAPPVYYDIGANPDSFVPNAASRSVVSGDFNGDGKLDVIVAHRDDNSLYFLSGNGNGTFKRPVKIAIAGVTIEGSIYVGDFNGDGRPDLFLPEQSSNSDVISSPVIMFGKGDGSFTMHIDTSSSFNAAGTYPRGWAIGDFNGDNKLDIAATLPGLDDSGGYIILLGHGNGTFTRGQVASGSALMHYSRWVATGDLNGDHKLDLVFADGTGAGTTTGTSELTVLLGNGDGTFRLGGHYASPGTPGADTLNPEDIFLADLNNDGKLDAIISNYDQNINVFIGNGNGTFQPGAGYTTGEYPRGLAFADVNGDGITDIIVCNIGVGPGGAEFAKEGARPGSVAVLLGYGEGKFRLPAQFNPFYYPGWLAVGDFNGDGRPDIAVTGVSEDHALGVMLN
jgi:hypothetical protein